LSRQRREDSLLDLRIVGQRERVSPNQALVAVAEYEADQIGARET
jgi:hypothetical protein